MFLPGYPYTSPSNLANPGAKQHLQGGLEARYLRILHDASQRVRKWSGRSILRRRIRSRSRLSGYFLNIGLIWHIMYTTNIIEGFHQLQLICILFKESKLVTRL